MEYDFEVTHRGSMQNIVQDPVSRMFEVEAQVAKISTTDMVNQITDPWHEKRVYQILKLKTKARLERNWRENI